MKPAGSSKFWSGVALLIVLVPALFWVRFGRVDGFAIGFTAFLLILTFGVEFLPRWSEKFGPPKAVAPRWYDRLGVIWLIWILVGPLLVWTIGALWPLSPSSWPWVLGLRAGVGILVPLICVLPLIRYVQRSTAGYAITILAVGTLFPVSCGWASAVDFVQGPRWEDVQILTVRHRFTTYHMRSIETPVLDVTLSDGRSYTANDRVVSISVGRTRLLILGAVGDVIASK